MEVSTMLLHWNTNKSGDLSFAVTASVCHVVQAGGGSSWLLSKAKAFFE